MQQSLSKIVTYPADKLLVKKIEDDGYCQKLIEVFSFPHLKPPLVRELNDIQSDYFTDKSIFSNGNIFILHGCLTNLRGCCSYLLAIDGYHAANIAKEIVGDTIKKNYRNSMNSIIDWIKKYEKLNVLVKSPLSSRREIKYEKNKECKEIADFVHYMCIRNMRMDILKIAKSSIPKGILNSNRIL